MVVWPTWPKWLWLVSNLTSRRFSIATSRFFISSVRSLSGVCVCASEVPSSLMCSKCLMWAIVKRIEEAHRFRCSNGCLNGALIVVALCYCYQSNGTLLTSAGASFAAHTHTHTEMDASMMAFAYIGRVWHGNKSAQQSHSETHQTLQFAQDNTLLLLLMLLFLCSSLVVTLKNTNIALKWILYFIAHSLTHFLHHYIHHKQ